MNMIQQTDFSPLPNQIMETLIQTNGGTEKRCTIVKTAFVTVSEVTHYSYLKILYKSNLRQTQRSETTEAKC